MAIISLPTAPDFRTSRFALVTNTQRFISPLNGAVQTRELPGARWSLSVTLPPMQRGQAAAWQAALAKLRGGANRFLAGDPDARTPRGVATGTPLVNGAAQTGGSLATDGWTASTTNILRAGDYISFTNGDANAELHMVVEDANSNGSGEATLAIEPPIRSAPADNAALTVTSAVCEMALVDDDQAAWDADQMSIYGISFSGVEVFT